MSSYWAPGSHSRRGLIISLLIFVAFGIMAFYLSAEDSPPAITQPSPKPH